MTSPARDERGSVSTWLLLSVATFMLIIGISVDLGGRMYALQEVQAVAAEAARTGAQQATTSDAIRGRAPDIDPAKATAAAHAYITSAGFTGTATVTGDQLHVRVTGTHTPTFLGAFGIGSTTLTGTADARLVRALNGAER